MPGKKRRRITVSDLAAGAGAALLVSGVALLSIPAAFILGGLVLIMAGLLGAKVEGT